MECCQYPLAGYEFTRSAFNLIRFIQFALCITTVGIAIYTIVDGASFIAPTFVVILAITSAAYTIITFIDIIATSYLKPIFWNSWILFAMSAVLFYFLCVGVLFATGAGTNDIILVGALFNFLAALSFLIDVGIILYLLLKSNMRVDAFAGDEVPKYLESGEIQEEEIEKYEDEDLDELGEKAYDEDAEYEGDEFEDEDMYGEGQYEDQFDQDQYAEPDGGIEDRAYGQGIPQEYPYSSQDEAGAYGLLDEQRVGTAASTDPQGAQGAGGAYGPYGAGPYGTGGAYGPYGPVDAYGASGMPGAGARPGICGPCGRPTRKVSTSYGGTFPMSKNAAPLPCPRPTDQDPRTARSVSMELPTGSVPRGDTARSRPDMAAAGPRKQSYPKGPYLLDPKTGFALSQQQIMRREPGVYQLGGLFIDPRSGTPVTGDHIGRGDIKLLDIKTGKRVTPAQISAGEAGIYYPGGVLIDSRTGQPLSPEQLADREPYLLDSVTGVALTAQQIHRGEFGVYYLGGRLIDPRTRQPITSEGPGVTCGCPSDTRTVAVSTRMVPKRPSSHPSSATEVEKRSIRGSKEQIGSTRGSKVLENAGARSEEILHSPNCTCCQCRDDDLGDLDKVIQSAQGLDTIKESAYEAESSTSDRKKKSTTDSRSDTSHGRATESDSELHRKDGDPSEHRVDLPGQAHEPSKSTFK